LGLTLDEIFFVVKFKRMRSRYFFFSLLIAVGLILITASPAYAYTVRRGDTLSLLAKRFKAPLNRLIQANRIKNPNLIYVGQQLIIPKSQATTIPPQKSLTNVWVEISLNKQKLSLYQGRKIIFKTSVSTGLARSPTPTGHFKVWAKLRHDDMEGGSRTGGDYYYLPKVPYVAYFYQGYAFHGTYWHKNFGRPMSRGCVNLSIPDARYLYKRIGIGTPVIIRT
jgi:lipoprotein-anchoring transpeptidase ErfK/SrfK